MPFKVILIKHTASI